MFFYAKIYKIILHAKFNKKINMLYLEGTKKYKKKEDMNFFSLFLSVFSYVYFIENIDIVKKQK